MMDNDENTLLKYILLNDTSWFKDKVEDYNNMSD